MRHRVSLIPGDGIGPEVTEATVQVVEAAGVQVDWQIVLAGLPAVRAFGSQLPDATVRSIKENGVALKGPLLVEKGKGHLVIVGEDGEQRHYPSINNALRREVGAFVVVRPIRTLRGVASRYDKVDVVIVREVTEGIYAGHEHRVGVDGAEAIKIVTRQASERAARYAFDYARTKGRKKVTVVHKANVLGLTDGLFLSCARRIAQDNPDIAFDDYMIDATVYQLVRDPSRFDVILADNQYGDILSDLCAGLAGSLGLAPGANIGDDASFFEATHGAAPDIAGQGIVNPIAMILSGVMMLEHLGEAGPARRIVTAVESVLAAGRFLTPDIGGRSSTAEITKAIIDSMQ